MEFKATDEQIFAAIKDANGIRATAAKKLGINLRTLMQRVKKMKAKGFDVPGSTYIQGDVQKAGFEFTPLPEDDIPVEQLIEHRKRQLHHKKAHE